MSPLWFGLLSGLTVLVLAAYWYEWKGEEWLASFEHEPCGWYAPPSTDCWVRDVEHCLRELQVPHWWIGVAAQHLSSPNHETEAWPQVSALALRAVDRAWCDEAGPAVAQRYGLVWGEAADCAWLAPAAGGTEDPARAWLTFWHEAETTGGDWHWRGQRVSAEATLPLRAVWCGARNGWLHVPQDLTKWGQVTDAERDNTSGHRVVPDPHRRVRRRTLANWRYRAVVSTLTTGDAAVSANPKL